MSTFEYLELRITVLVGYVRSFAQGRPARGAGVRLPQLRQISDRESRCQLSDLYIKRTRKRFERFRIGRLASLNPLDCSKSNI
jgi:hypothetical protein